MARLKRRSMATENSALETPRRRTRAGASTRERILIQAERLFASRGFNGVTMPAIAEASGITAGAIYKHFTSKAELFFHVVRQAVEQAPMAPEVSLPAMVASYTTRRLKQVRQMAVEVHYAAGKDADVRRLLRRSLDRQIGEIRDGFAAAQRAGDLPAADPQLLATAVMAFIMGLMHMETLSPQLIGDPRWQAFVADRTAALLGVR
jgi:AcrR family transcriptional regulator